MELFEALAQRRSIRTYRKQALNEGTVETLINAARLAPSAGNGQPVEFVIAQEEQTMQRLSMAAYGQKSLTESSAVIVVCVDEKRASQSYGERGKVLYCIQDSAAAIQNILLTAVSIGLGTCWIGAFKEEEVKKVVNAPKHMRPVALIPIGYPNEMPPARARRPISELIHKETF
jgi:nitroreductase